MFTLLAHFVPKSANDTCGRYTARLMSLLKRVIEYNGMPYTRRVVEEYGARLILPSGAVLYHCREETDEEMEARVMALILGKDKKDGEEPD